MSKFASLAAKVDFDQQASGLRVRTGYYSAMTLFERIESNLKRKLTHREKLAVHKAQRHSAYA